MAGRAGGGAAVCRAANPRLIWCAITGYGQDGPYRDRPGHDVNYLSYAGAMGITCGRDGAPVVPGLQAADTLAGIAALSGILLALCERTTSGEGRFVDACMLDAAVSVQGIHFAAHEAGQLAGPRAMPLNGGIPCYDTYVTGDGRAEVLGASYLGGEVAILTGGESPVLYRLEVEGYPYGFATGDFDGDGRVDFAIANDRTDQVTVFVSRS